MESRPQHDTSKRSPEAGQKQIEGPLGRRTTQTGWCLIQKVTGYRDEDVRAPNRASETIASSRSVLSRLSLTAYDAGPNKARPRPYLYRL